MRVDVVIPAFNEERVVGDVVRSIPRPPVGRIVVADNNSRDRTAAAAAAAGAIVVPAPRQGYGSACLAGLAWLRPRAQSIRCGRPPPAGNRRG